MEQMQMTREGIKVVFKTLLTPKYPARVIVPSATTRARVPASVESSPPLKVPRESLDDMTRDRSDKFTPGLVQQVLVFHFEQVKQELSKTCHIFRTCNMMA